MADDKAPPKPPTPAQATAQVAMLAGVAVLFLNVLFYFVGGKYFEIDDPLMKGNKIVDSARMGTAWVAFGVFTVSIAVATVLATWRPKLVGHGIAAIAGVASVAAAFGAFGRDMPMVLPVTLLILGGTLPALAYYSMQKNQRAAWSFLIALCGTFATVLLFGAPKVRGVLGIGFWNALIIPGLLTVATVALSRVSADYREA